MKRFAVPIALSALGLSSASIAAEFNGRITQANGTTPVAGVQVSVYRYDVVGGGFDYTTATISDSTGNFSAKLSGDPTAQIGTYFIYFGSFTNSSLSASPFYEYVGWYRENPSAPYYLETYDDVTALTPLKAPTLLAIKSPNDKIQLKPIKLNPKTKGCVITGPMTINKTVYNTFGTTFFGTTPPSAPALPETGGKLDISFKVVNLGSTPLTTNLEAIAFVTRRDDPAYTGMRSLIENPKRKAVLPKGTSTVTLSATIPKGVMPATPGPFSYDLWAFNVGIQSQDPASGIANCFDLTLFPVVHEIPSRPASMDAAEDSAAPTGPIVPLKLDENGQPTQWGPAPAN